MRHAFDCDFFLFWLCFCLRRRRRRLPLTFVPVWAWAVTFIQIDCSRVATLAGPGLSIVQIVRKVKAINNASFVCELLQIKKKK